MPLRPGFGTCQSVVFEMKLSLSHTCCVIFTSQPVCAPSLSTHTRKHPLTYAEMSTLYIYMLTPHDSAPGVRVINP